MRSVALLLPPYVVVRPRKRGTARVLFEVPPRLRPPGWPPTIPLPQQPPRTGNLSDPAELARIIADAKALHAALTAARAGAVVTPAAGRDLDALIARWEGDWANRQLSVRTMRAYRQHAKILRAWAALPPVRGAAAADIQPSHIAQLLRVYQDRPTTAKHLRETLSTILAFGVELGWLAENTAMKVARRRRPPGRIQPVTLWTPEDVAAHVAIAEEIGWLGGAILILGLWESMGRVSDAVLWTQADWDPASRQLVYATSKSLTQSVAVAVMSPRFAALVARTRAPNLVTQPNDRPYRPATDDTRLAEHFRERVNARAIAQGGRKLILRHLRHSAQTHAIACGATHDQTAVFTTHLDPRLARDRYIQKSLGIAAEVARLRGIAAD